MRTTNSYLRNYFKKLTEAAKNPCKDQKGGLRALTSHSCKTLPITLTLIFQPCSKQELQVQNVYFNLIGIMKLWENRAKDFFLHFAAPAVKKYSYRSLPSWVAGLVTACWAHYLQADGCCNPTATAPLWWWIQLNTGVSNIWSLWQPWLLDHHRSCCEILLQLFRVNIRSASNCEYFLSIICNLYNCTFLDRLGTGRPAKVPVETSVRGQC